jgi:4-hydroxy-2-oxoheptanedioate aldolase
MTGGAADLAAQIRGREPAVGYWVVLDAPVATERIARLGYDFVVLDGQHGLIGYHGLVSGLLALDAGGASPGLVRVEGNATVPIGRALDAGAAGVIVPLVDDAEQAAAAVAAARYPPAGVRSYGPMRSGLRIGPAPREADAGTLLLAMIETAQGLANVEAICATPGLDGIFVGPYDLALALGGEGPGDPAIADAFDAALARILAAARTADVAAGIYTPDGASAARRLAEGFTFATVASDLVHLEQAAARHLARARQAVAQR